ncbi:MAG TPA: hypothetical protein VN950_12665 [Terriglobales bacterium]|nr:hypothetical protein [Terriglobales bacterium]
MRYLLILSVLLFGTCWAAAQNNPSQGGSSQANSSGSSTTVEGCLSSNNGNYTLTDSKGNNIALTGDTSKLSEHVGHTVKITGTMSTSASPSDGSSSAMGQTSASQQAIDVSSVKHISKTCNNGGSH